jgi:toxin-antitoxin system PIN domain toxin
VRALLDVNVLIALLDADHASHAAALSWFARHAEYGWASCPITQNGCMRIMSHPNYPGAPSVSEIVQRLRRATRESVHEFWPDDVNLVDDQQIDTTRIHGPRMLTDVYLLALAVRHGGALVTFDRSIAIGAVRNASATSLIVL